VVDVLKTFIENPIFYRGIIPWVGFKQIGLNYEALERHAGMSKYSFVKMVEFAIEGVTSFSIKPLRLSIYMGVIVSAAAFVYLFYALYIKFFSTTGIPGWTSLMVCVLFIGGIQLIMLGIVGEYIGKLFIQSKGRPPYILKEKSQGF
jgi:glycosyltransferase involved in cell wall biosynthesis